MGKLGTPVTAAELYSLQQQVQPQATVNKVPAWPVNTRRATPRIRDRECTPMTAAYRGVKRVEDSKLTYARQCARTLAQLLIRNGQLGRADETLWVDGILKKYGVAGNHIVHGRNIVRQMVHASRLKH